MTVHFRAAKLLHYYFKNEIIFLKNFNNNDNQLVTSSFRAKAKP